MYENLGIEGSRNLLVTGIYNCVGPLCNLVFITFFLDRVGRKKVRRTHPWRTDHELTIYQSL